VFSDSGESPGNCVREHSLRGASVCCTKPGIKPKNSKVHTSTLPRLKTPNCSILLLVPFCNKPSTAIARIGYIPESTPAPLHKKKCKKAISSTSTPIAVQTTTNNCYPKLGNEESAYPQIPKKLGRFLPLTIISTAHQPAQDHQNPSPAKIIGDTLQDLRENLTATKKKSVLRSSRPIPRTTC
jgi:hypothetical protein